MGSVIANCKSGNGMFFCAPWQPCCCPTQAGDLRPYLSGFFDTTSGAKSEPSSYKEIALTLGMDSPSELLFATDVLAEAQVCMRQ